MVIPSGPGALSGGEAFISVTSSSRVRGWTKSGSVGVGGIAIALPNSRTIIEKKCGRSWISGF